MMNSIRIVVSVAFALCASQAFAATHTEVTKVPRLPFLNGMGFDGYYEGRNRTWMTRPDIYTDLANKRYTRPPTSRTSTTHSPSAETAQSTWLHRFRRVLPTPRCSTGSRWM